MKVLFLGAYWLGWDLLARSLKSTGEHDVVVVRYDPPRAGSRRIPELVKPLQEHTQFDVIAYAGVGGGSCTPTNEEYAWMKNQAPTVLISPEASDKNWWYGTVRAFQSAKGKFKDLVVNIDGNKEWPDSELGLTLLTPIDPGAWKTPKPWSERTQLCGSWSNRCGPRDVILSALGDNVKWIGNMPPRPEFEEEDNLTTYDLYVDFNRNCKCVLNVAHRGGDAGKHVKGRVIEAGWARACLLEEVESQTKDWFTPDEDYITYEAGNATSALAQIRWVDAHPDEAQVIANNLHTKVVRDHCPKVFWSKVFNKLFSN